MSALSKINNRALIQYCIVVLIVWGIGFYKRNYPNEKAFATEEKDFRVTDSEIYPTNAFDKFVNTYPEEFFKSDEVWETYKENHKTETILYTGKGRINDHPVKVEFLLRRNGTLVGRYHNPIGINLDMNGYLDSKTGALHIHLGHAKDNTLSRWTLDPVGINEKNKTYDYKGVWGKKALPSNLTIKEN